jgi:TP901 family phage tail tape measure protein
LQLFDIFGSIRIDGLDSVNSGLSGIGSVVDTVGSKLSSVGATITDFGQTIMSVGSTLTDNITKPLIGFGEEAVMTAATFEQALSVVKGVTDASSTDMDRLKVSAENMGKTTSKTATDAANAFQYMGLAGWSVDEMLTAVEPMLRASEAGMMDLGKTSDLVTDSMSALGLKTSDMGRYLDIAAKAQSTSNQSMDQFLTAMGQAGGVFKMFNVPLEEAGALLGILANRKFKGAQAGNALISIMNNLTARSGQAGKAIKDLGIETYDADGKFRGMTVILKEINEKFKGMTNEQRDLYTQMIGGKTRTKEFAALLNGTAEELDGLTGKLKDSDGALNKMALTMQDNLLGRITILKSAFEGILIQIGDLLIPYVEIAVGWLQTLAEWFSKLDPSVHIATVVIAAITAAIPILITVFGGLIVIVGSVISAIGAIAAVSAPVIAAIVGIGLVLVPLIAGFTAVTGAMTFVLVKTGVLQAAFEKIKGVFEFLASMIKGNVTDAYMTLVDKLGLSHKEALVWIDRFELVKAKTLQVIDVIKGIGDILVSAFSGDKNNLIKNLASTFGLSEGQAKSFAQTILTARDNIIYFANVVKSFYENQLKGLISGLITVGKYLVDHKSEILGVIKMVVDWANTILGVGKTILEFFGVKFPASSKQTDKAINKTLQEFINLEAKAKGKLDTLATQGLAITKKSADDISKQYKVMGDKILKAIDDRQKKELKSMTDFFADSKVLTNKEEQATIKQLNQKYDNHKITITQAEEQIKTILTNASNKKRALTDDEKKVINRIQKEMEDTAIKYMSDGKASQVAIFDDLKNKVSVATQEEANEIVKNAKKAKDGSIKEANDLYDKKVKQIAHMRDDLKVISADEADKMIQEAQKTKNGSVAEANDLYNKTTSKLTEKKTKNVSTAEAEKKATVDKSTEMKNTVVKVIEQLVNDAIAKLGDLPGKLGNSMKNFGKKVVDDIVSGITGVISNIGKAMDNIINTITSKANDAKNAATGLVSGIVPGFAGGVQNFSGGWAMVGERGAELVHLPTGSDVYTANETQRILKNGAVSNNTTVANNKTDQTIIQIDQIILDAKNVKEFNDVVKVIQKIPVQAVTRR